MSRTTWGNATRIQDIISIVLVLLFACCFTSCATLDESHVEPASPPKRGIVFLFPGLVLPGENYLHTGTNTLAKSFRSLGVRTEINYASEWAAVADEFVASAPEVSLTPVAVVGYSYGANTAIAFARRLGAYGINVQTMVLIEATDPAAIPVNVRRALHIRVSNGQLSRAVVPDSRFTGSIENRAYVPRDSQEEEIDHWSISRSEEIYTVVLSEILDSTGVRQRWLSSPLDTRQVTRGRP